MTVNNLDVLRVATRFTGVHQQDIMNVWYFQANLAASQADAAVMTALDTYLSSAIVPFDGYLDNSITPLDMKVDVVQWLNGKWEVTYNVGTSAWGASITPASTADALPEGASALAFLRVGLGKHQGRKFLGGFAEDGNSPSGALDSTMQTTILSGLATLLTPYVISAGNELATAILDHTDGTIRYVIELALNGFWAYQRRRRPGVGS